MAIEDHLNQLATIQLEPDPMARDRLGGANRSGEWSTVAVGVPCLVDRLGSNQQVRDDARRNAVDARVYFAADPAPGGIGSRHRIVVGTATYQVLGSANPNSLNRIIEVDCETIQAT